VDGGDMTLDAIHRLAFGDSSESVDN